jgi:hypothetical protein
MGGIMITCYKCKETKPSAEFKPRNGKITSLCKKCHNISCSNSSKSYRESPVGRANRTWHKILQRVGNKDGKNPSYANIECRMTQNEFLTWAIPLYEEFAIKHPNETPSLDRADSNGHYEISNLQVIPLTVNLRKKKRHGEHIVFYISSNTDRVDMPKKVAEHINRICIRLNLSSSQIIELL